MSISPSRAVSPGLQGDGHRRDLHRAGGSLPAQRLWCQTLRGAGGKGHEVLQIGGAWKTWEIAGLVNVEVPKTDRVLGRMVFKWCFFLPDIQGLQEDMFNMEDNLEISMFGNTYLKTYSNQILFNSVSQITSK